MGAADEVMQVPGHLPLSHKHSGKLLEEILVSAPQTPAHGAVAKPRAQVTPPSHPCSGRSRWESHQCCWGSQSRVLGGEGALGLRDRGCPQLQALPSSPLPTEEDFGKGPWLAMKTELGLDERDPGCFLHTYSVVMVLRKVRAAQDSAPCSSLTPWSCF